MKFLSLFLLCFSLIYVAHAEDEIVDNFPQSRKYSNKISAHCWAVSLKDRSQPDLEIVDEGHFKTAECFEKYYVDIYMHTTFNKGRMQSKEEINNLFEDLRKSYSKIYYNMNYTGSPLESNFSTNITNAQYSSLIADMLSDLIYNTYTYKDYAAQEYIENIKI